MTEMISHLSKFREEIPTWLKNYRQGDKITFKDIMSSRVAYYPGSGHDGTLMKVGNMSHSVHSFLYVDYGLSKSGLEDHIAQENSIRGYHPIAEIEWQEKDLMPNGQHQYPAYITAQLRHKDPYWFVDKNEKPYCFSVIMERDEDRDDTWGAERFVVTFLFADGIATYYQLFVKEYSMAPWLFLLQDHGFGGNYDRYGAGGILDQIIRESRCYPTFVIFGNDGDSKMWKGYEQVADVTPLYRGMHRRDLYKLSQVATD